LCDVVNFRERERERERDRERERGERGERDGSFYEPWRHPRFFGEGGEGGGAAAAGGTDFLVRYARLSFWGPMILLLQRGTSAHQDKIAWMATELKEGKGEEEQTGREESQ
jgi:hypothetical protein